MSNDKRQGLVQQFQTSKKALYAMLVVSGATFASGLLGSFDVYEVPSVVEVPLVTATAIGAIILLWGLK